MSDVAELVREIGGMKSDVLENKGSEGTQQQQTTQTQQTQQQTQGASQQQSNKSQTTTPPATKNGQEGVKINKIEEKQTTQAASGTQSSGQTSQAEAEIPEEKLISHLSKLTEGAISKPGQLKDILSELTDLRTQVAEGIKPKFANERAKWAHELLANNPGGEIQATLRTLRGLAFTGEGKTDKDWLFQKFLMDPKNSDLSEAEAPLYFEADFNEKYGKIEYEDEEGAKKKDLVKERALRQEVNEAKAQITKMQEEFKSHEETPKQISKEVEQAVQGAIQNFKGLQFKLKEDAPENEIFNLAVTDPNEIEFLKQSILNPDAVYADLINEFATDKGYDYNGLTQELYIRQNARKLIKLASDHAYKLGQLSKVNEARNTDNGKNISDLGSVTGQQEETLMGAWKKAANIKG